MPARIPLCINFYSVTPTKRVEEHCSFVAAPYYDVDNRHKGKVSYADVARGTCVVQSLTDSNLLTHRGKRQHAAITVETFMTGKQGLFVTINIAD